MKNSIVVFLYGLVISFLGSLPFGTLNLTAFQLATSGSLSDAYTFVAAVVIIELCIVYITLIAAHKIIQHRKLFSIFLVPAILLLIYLSVSAFSSAGAVSSLHIHPSVFPGITSPLLLGILLSVFNPLLIPFWMSWNSILLAKKKMDNSSETKASYITGIGLGSAMAISLFIIVGKQSTEYLSGYHNLISYSMSLVYLGFALYLLFRHYKNRIKLQTQQ